MHQQQTEYQFTKAISAVAAATVFLVPIAFNPVSANLFDLSKNAILVLATCLGIFIWAARNIWQRQVKLWIVPFTLPLVLLTIVTLVSSFTNLMQFTSGFISVGVTITMLTLLYIIVATNANQNTGKWLINALVASGVILSITAVMESINIGPSSWITALTPGIQNSNLFISPTGSPISLVAILITTLLVCLYFAIESKNTLYKTGYFIASAITTAAVVVAVFNIIPGKTDNPAVLSHKASWEIAVENMKRPRSFFIGVGPQNYVAAFSAFKPIAFNSSTNWNARYNTASNLPLHIFTTTGVIGLAAWLWLVFEIFKQAKTFNKLSHTGKASIIGLGVTIIFSLLLPPTTVTWLMTFTLTLILALDVIAHQPNLAHQLSLGMISSKLSLPGKNSSVGRVVATALTLPMIAIGLLLLYGTFRVYAADLTFRKSLITAAANEGTSTYNLQRRAIQQNPFLSAYHRSYATTNLSIASALIQRGELSEEDKVTVTTLIRQAIREGLAAVQTDPANPQNWESLAQIYRNLINVADGSDQWAITAYANAIQRDPRSPRLRVELGGLYYQLGQYDNAIKLFQQAVLLKPDYTNAHYNLANALAQDEQTKAAIDSYDQVLSLLEPTSPDYAKAVEEQNALKKKLGQPENTVEAPPAQPQEIATPSPLPTPVTEIDPLDLTNQEPLPESNVLEEVLPSEESSQSGQTP